ncbi:MAG: hypothetical protein JOZ75_12585, partial [Candidatus Dormibacteraeota bacterium]|nr:hypothetical protein [Candidatus Dormibacteraeota bacterium]
GGEIDAFESTADPAVGAFLTIHANSIDVRLASGSAATYAERDFHGTGVTSFGEANGAAFSSPLTETTAAAQNRGTVESISSIAGSVSCGTFTPGGGTVAITGDATNGTVTGNLSSLRVTCGTAAQPYALVMGIANVGSNPMLVEISGGNAGNPMYVSIGSTMYKSVASGSVTLTAGGATYNATVTETSASGTPGTHSLRVSGTVTCGA